MALTYHSRRERIGGIFVNKGRYYTAQDAVIYMGNAPHFRCPPHRIRLYFISYPFITKVDNMVATFDVLPSRPISEAMGYLSIQVSQHFRLHSTFPFHLPSVDMNYWLDPKKSWERYGIMSSEVRPLYPVAHGPVDDPDRAFGTFFNNLFCTTPNVITHEEVQEMRTRYTERATNIDEHTLVHNVMLQHCHLCQ
eukprot:TRINITY_DN9105_c1_g1_i3.p1 TRINITY_DN9105_c1_g1~~TRINITY_DN9105_c1_g1_i3.p1  ORF type:complete len:194 (+),score=11.29 TRINITY_DN9105_c1_g1_i3:210-791(+)